jgi:hypothetical protein
MRDTAVHCCTTALQPTVGYPQKLKGFLLSALREADLLAVVKAGRGVAMSSVATRAARAAAAAVSARSAVRRVAGVRALSSAA